jgi:HAE1 family hydrophobic/amphiphilic exporter-1
MTLICTVMSGLPLILGSGPGSEAREAIGWVIVGGLGLAAVFTLFLTPAAYALVSGLDIARARPAAGARRSRSPTVPEITVSTVSLTSSKPVVSG